jgi:hypothetical protein
MRVSAARSCGYQPPNGFELAPIQTQRTPGLHLLRLHPRFNSPRTRARVEAYLDLMALWVKAAVRAGKDALIW